MSSKGRIFAGCSVALVTPFLDGEVDFGALGRTVDWQIDQGTPFLPGGHNGRRPHVDATRARTSDRDRGRTGRGPGPGSGRAGSCSTAETVRLTRFAAEAGADGALVVAPVLQSARAGWALRPFRTASLMRARSPWYCTMCRPAPAVTSNRRRSSGWPTRKHRRDQGSKWLARSGQRDHLRTDLTVSRGTTA